MTCCVGSFDRVADVECRKGGWLVSHQGKALGLAYTIDHARRLAQRHGLSYRVLRDGESPHSDERKQAQRERLAEERPRRPCERCGRRRIVKLNLCGSCYIRALKSEFSTDIATMYGCLVNGCQYLGVGSFGLCDRHRRQVTYWAEKKGMAMLEFRAFLADYEEANHEVHQ
jgi:hypothetical protein